MHFVCGDKKLSKATASVEQTCATEVWRQLIVAVALSLYIYSIFIYFLSRKSADFIVVFRLLSGCCYFHVTIGSLNESVHGRRFVPVVGGTPMFRNLIGAGGWEDKEVISCPRMHQGCLKVESLQQLQKVS